MKRWIAVFLLFLAYVFGSVTEAPAQDGRPTFYPNRAVREQSGTRPVMEQDAPAGRDILGADTDSTFGYPYQPYPNQGGYPDYRPGMSPLLLTGDPVSMIPYAVDMANRYGIVQCIAVLLVLFIFQYVRSAQKSASQREEFFHQQLNYSDKRTTDELTRLSSKLALMEQDLRSLQDRFDRHAELIRTNGQLCREIVSTMTAHNLAVEQGIAGIASKIDALAMKVKRKLKTPDRDDKS